MEFQWGNRFTISPNLNIDFVDGERLYVFGAALGIGF
jgi:hypothetical protein